MLAAVALGVVATPARAAVPGCDQLTVESVRDGAGALDLEATVPANLGLVTVPSSAFTYVQDGITLPVSAARRDPGDRTVAVVLGRTTESTDGSFRLALSAVRELVGELPRDVRVALVSGVGPAAVVVPLTKDHAATLDALPGLRLQEQQDTGTALGLAVAQLPPQSRRHVVIVDADAPGQVALPEGVALHKIGSAASGQGCPASGANTDVIAEVDAVVARLSGEYLLDVPGGRVRGRLLLDYLGTASSAEVSATSATQSSAPAALVRRGERNSQLTASTIGLLLAGVALAALVATGALALLVRRRRSMAAPVAAGASRSRAAVPATAPGGRVASVTAGSPELRPAIARRRPQHTPTSADRAAPAAASPPGSPPLAVPVTPGARGAALGETPRDAQGGSTLAPQTSRGWRERPGRSPERG